MSKPLQRGAAQCVVDYLKATQSLGPPLKEKIDVLFDAAFVAGVIGKERIDPNVIAIELAKFELAQKRNVAPNDGEDFG